VTTTLNAVVGSGVDPATNSTSVDHLLINDAYVLLLGLVQNQVCNYAFSTILQFPDVASEICPEIETSMQGKPSSCGSLAGGGSGGGSSSGSSGSQGGSATTSSAPSTPSTCPFDDMCDGVCVNLDTDPINCGACGNFCDSGICSGGGCTCSEGLTNCDGTCTDLITDDLNCGQCGNTCIFGCVSGTCNECSDFFGPGWVLCPVPDGESYCTSLLDTDSDCGSCGNVCSSDPASSETCINGICVPEIV
jgi:hypothetical protein